MDFPVLLTIRIENSDEYKLLQHTLDAVKLHCSNTIGLVESVSLLERAQLRRFDGKQARLLLSGKVVATGSLDDIQMKFQTECDIHKSNVAIEEWVDGKFIQIKSRFVNRPCT